MIIKVKYFGLITENLISEIKLPEGNNVSNLLEYLGNIEPKSKDILKRATILVNKTNANLQTVLNDNDEVMILTVLGGG